MNFKKKATVIALSSVAMISTTSISASAADYTTYISRGIKYIAYCKTSFKWSTDWRNEVKDGSTAWQSNSGFDVQAGGVNHKGNYYAYDDWIAITNVVMGITIKGVGIGYTVSYEDEVELLNNGDIYVIWD